MKYFRVAKESKRCFFKNVLEYVPAPVCDYGGHREQ